MWIIKNRVTGEYERKGTSCKRDKFNRHAWDTLARAKCHVAYIGFDEWFMDADFVEVTEEGTGRIEPVVDYLIEYYGQHGLVIIRRSRRGWDCCHNRRRRSNDGHQTD